MKLATVKYRYLVCTLTAVLTIELVFTASKIRFESGKYVLNLVSYFPVFEIILANLLIQFRRNSPQ